MARTASRVICTSRARSVARTRVARLIQAAGLKARHKRRRGPTDVGLRQEHRIATNVLARQFEAAAPNRKWVADFTYLWTAEGWLFVAAVMDLYSRRIVGWSMADVFDYVERFYHPRRRHSTLGYLSPVQFEQRLMG